VGDEVGYERVDDRARAAARDGPAVGVCERAEEQGRARRRQGGDPGDRVGGDPGEERRRDVVAEPRVPQRRPLLGDGEAEARRAHEVAQDLGRDAALVTESSPEDRVRRGCQRAEQGAPRRAVDPEGADRALDVAVGDPGPSPVERLGVGGLRLEELDAAGAEVELTEERRRHTHGMDGGTDVVNHAVGEPEARGARPSPGGGLRLEDEDLQPGTRERHRSREPVGA
jgi:hypothetical protein